MSVACTVSAAQPAAAFGFFGLRQMAAARVGTQDLAGGRYFEPLGHRFFV